jgi:hypothetical protein
MKEKTFCLCFDAETVALVWLQGLNFFVDLPLLCNHVINTGACLSSMMRSLNDCCSRFF